MQSFHRTRRIVLGIVAVGLFFSLGYYVGGKGIPEINKVFGLDNKVPNIASGVSADFSPFWKAWNTIDDKYPGADEVDNQKRIFGAISGLVNSLDDPYSVFFDPEETESFEAEIAGNFSGVGMEVGIRDRILTVIAPLKDTPAYRAKIKSGDKILKIDDEVTVGMGIEEAIRLIRGEVGTVVRLTILHEGDDDTVDIDITRAIIEIPTIDTDHRDDGVFVISLYSFSANSPSLFRGAIQEFALSGSNRLILDLRGNPGGYLDAAVDMSSWFLPKGKVVVTEDYSGGRKQEVFRSRGYDVFNDSLKFVILIDGGSASASEILAGAMRDHGKATLVGTKSFGKGSVQEAIKMTSDTLLKITVAKWLTPNGDLIEGIGLTPDYVVEISRDDLDNDNDAQLNKAVELLLK